MLRGADRRQYSSGSTVRRQYAAVVGKRRMKDDSIRRHPRVKPAVKRWKEAAYCGEGGKYCS